MSKDLIEDIRELQQDRLRYRAFRAVAYGLVRRISDTKLLDDELMVLALAFLEEGPHGVGPLGKQQEEIDRLHAQLHAAQEEWNNLKTCPACGCEYGGINHHDNCVQKLQNRIDALQWAIENPSTIPCKSCGSFMLGHDRLMQLCAACGKDRGRTNRDDAAWRKHP